jgi:4-cresol dehydrogenase (hydroxylating)
LLAGQTYLSGEARAGLRGKLAVAPWTVTGGIYGSAAQVRASEKLIKKALRPFGRVTLLGDTKLRLLGWLRRFWAGLKPGSRLSSILRFLTGSSPEKLNLIGQVYPILKGVPGEDIVSFAYFKSPTRRRTDVDPARDGAGLMWLALVSPLTGKDIGRLLGMCEPIFHRHGFDLSVSFIMVNPRSTLALLEIFYDKENAEEKSRALALYDEATEATVAAGFPQYRTSVAYSDRMLKWAPGWRHLLDSLKTAVDPNNILAPGRYGIGLRE